MAEANVQSRSERTAFEDLDDAAEAILTNWKSDAQEEPSDALDEVATDDDVSETDNDITDEIDTETEDLEDDEKDPETDETEASNQEEEEVEEIEIDEDFLLDIAVDGETKQASIKDLKRLYGQEASLTRKSQEAASLRKQADENLQRTSAQMQRMIKRAEERYKPYSEVDMLVASRQMNAQEFAALRQEAKSAEEDLKFLKEESESFYSELTKQHQEAQRKAATEAVKVLEEQLPGWNDTMYNEIRTYAINSGLGEGMVNQITDPTTIMLLNKARLFDQGKKAATVKKTKIKATPKILRSKKAPPTAADRSAAKRRKTMDTLRTGDANDLDIVADAIMSRWEA